jgi:methanogenic corrinoid protein MtbC1
MAASVRVRKAGAGGAQAALAHIAAVERDTGFPKDTLRVWERRYGFPAPQRDAGGQRWYAPCDVEKLRLARRLIDSGYRPGKILSCSIEELRILANSLAPPLPARADEHRDSPLAPYLELLAQHRTEELRRQLARDRLRMGLAPFVSQLVAPLNACIGEAWARGALEVFEEHLYTEAIVQNLREALAGIPRPGSSPPVVLLATLPREMHSIGLLMAQAFFALEGCRCISLGTQLPVPEIALAASSQQPDLVAISCSEAMGSRGLLDAISQLRGQLPARIELWTGGANPALRRQSIAGVRNLRSLSEIGPNLQRWKREHTPMEGRSAPPTARRAGEGRGERGE